VIGEGAGKLNFKNRKPLVKKSFYGTMIIGSKADDLYKPDKYRSPVILMLEPGGNDRYELAFNTGWGNYCYLLLDYQGIDSYLNAKPELFSMPCPVWAMRKTCKAMISIAVEFQLRLPDGYKRLCR
jgi:hypothetical protein